MYLLQTWPDFTEQHLSEAIIEYQKENDDLGKQVNKLAKQLPLKTALQYVLITFIFAISALGNAQELDYEGGENITLPVYQ